MTYIIIATILFLALCWWSAGKISKKFAYEQHLTELLNTTISSETDAITLEKKLYSAQCLAKANNTDLKKYDDKFVKTEEKIRLYKTFGAKNKKDLDEKLLEFLKKQMEKGDFALDAKVLSNGVAITLTVKDEENNTK